MVRFWLDFIYVYVWVLGLLNDQVLAVIFSPFIPAQSARRMPLSYIPRSSPRETHLSCDHPVFPSTNDGKAEPGPLPPNMVDARYGSTASSQPVACPG
ncbi:hypothetical protein EV126DRAFT_437189 [Verticillium dahliae]|nr:hypothetical protein EV126DRAFT_437189 [Verticillium dahliae]